MPRLLLLLPLLLFATIAHAEDNDDAEELSELRKVVRGFSKIDERYIEPQHYDFAFMMQGTMNLDYYSLSSANGQTIDFSPDNTLKVGPYFGWRWIFLGYTFDLKDLNIFKSSKKKEIEFSIYSSQIGVDLFYRRTGNDYKIREASIDGANTDRLINVDFNGLNVGTTGFNLYYIFNHKRFSYPAAYSQSTVQKISCGSWIAGIGYTHNTLELDYDKLKQTVEAYTVPTVSIDSSLMFNKVIYNDFNITGGYSYNWVFAKNCLFNVSASLALAYKHTSGENHSNFLNFSTNNFNIDGIFRFALVYNNTKWYAGTSAIIHTYTYEKDRFSSDNIFGSLNFYVGFNFKLKESYREKKE